MTVYILASRKNWALYVWVTNNLEQRLLYHKNWLSQHTSKYNIKLLVWFQDFDWAIDAIWYEKKVKKRSRKKKIWLIEVENPEWNDLSWV